VDEEWMRPGHWLGFVLWVTFSALTLMVGSQEGCLARKIPCSTNPERFSSGTGGGGGPKGNQLTQAHLERRLLNGSSINTVALLT